MCPALPWLKTSTMTSLPGLTAEQLSLSAGPTRLLNDISFHLPPRQVLGVLGPNGAGKTSLLQQIAGASGNRLKSSGTISWQGEAVQQIPLHERARRIAQVDQLHDSVFALTLFQVVRMGLIPHQPLFALPNSQDDHQVMSVLQQVGLQEKARQEFATLSGGEQQRGLIARALLQRAGLLLLDEPVNHLDVYYQHSILALLKGLSRRPDDGLTVVMSLHDINLAAAYCDQLAIVAGGRLLAFGQPAEVLTAELLERVFGLTCIVNHTEHGTRVDFCPSTAEAIQL